MENEKQLENQTQGHQDDASVKEVEKELNKAFRKLTGKPEEKIYKIGNKQYKLVRTGKNSWTRKEEK